MKSTTIRLCIFTLVLLLVAVVVTAQTTQPPDYDVRIVFLGLMNFDLSDSKAPVVIVPNVKNGFKHLGDMGDASDPIHQHVAYVLAGLTEMPANDPLNRNYVFEAPDEGEDRYQYLELNGEQIAIDDDNGAAELNTVIKYNAEGCTTKCPSRENHDHLCWLSSLQEVRGDDSLTKNDKYFNRIPSVKDVAARVPIRYGALDARVIGYGKPLTAPVWAFAKPVKGLSDPVPPMKALAQEVHWTFKAKGVPFVLNLLGFNGVGRRLAFTPTFVPGDPRGSLLIVIANTIREDTGPVAVVAAAAKDPHYSVYHRFVANNDPGLGNIPQRTDDSCTEFVYPPTLTANTQSLQQPVAESDAIHTHSNAPSNAGAPPAAPPSHPQATPGGLNCTGSLWKPKPPPTGKAVRE